MFQDALRVPSLCFVGDNLTQPLEQSAASSYVCCSLTIRSAIDVKERICITGELLFQLLHSVQLENYDCLIKMPVPACVL